MELYDTMRTTFAARDYTGDAVSDAVLYKILENARFAPSGGNRQGNRVIVVRDKAKRKQIAELVVPAAKLCCSFRGVTLFRRRRLWETMPIPVRPMSPDRH